MGKYKFRISGKFGFTEDCLWVIQYSGIITPGEKGPSILVGDGKSLVLMRGIHYFGADKRAMSNQIFYFIYYIITQKDNLE